MISVRALSLLPPLLLLILSTGTEGCQPTRHPIDMTSCQTACDRLEKLNCPNGVAAVDGTLCRTWLCETPICTDANADARRWGRIAASDSCEVAKAASCE